MMLPSFQRRGGSVDLHTDRRGLLWLLDEESVFPGGSDGSFLDRVHMYHGSGTGIDAPLVKVVKEDNQFLLSHCQRTLPVLYDANEWVRRAREHPSFRVVVNILAASKRSVSSCFLPHPQGVGSCTFPSGRWSIFQYLATACHAPRERQPCWMPQGVEQPYCMHECGALIGQEL